MDDLGVLTQRIHALLDRTEDGAEIDPAIVEHTLTDGYAQALALEGERTRTAERIHALAGHEEHANEVHALKSRNATVDAELARLRHMLKGLAATL